MSPIRFNCPSCGVPLKFDAPPPEGKKFHCPKCKANIKVSGKKNGSSAPAESAAPAPEATLNPAAERPAPAPLPPRIFVEPVSPEPIRGRPAATRAPGPTAAGASDLLWKLVVGSISMIMLACLLLLAFWNYIPK